MQVSAKNGARLGWQIHGDNNCVPTMKQYNFCGRKRYCSGSNNNCHNFIFNKINAFRFRFFFENRNLVYVKGGEQFEALPRAPNTLAPALRTMYTV